jgi:hypothetical protein
MGLYEHRLLRLASELLDITSTVIKELAAFAGWTWNKEGIGIEIGIRETPLTTEQVYSDVDIGKQLVFSSVLLTVLILTTDRAPLGWLAFPFEVLWHSISIWADVELSFASILSTIGLSIAKLFGFVPLLMLAILACAIVARPYGCILSIFAKRLSLRHIRTLNVVLLGIGSALVLLAT